MGFVYPFFQYPILQLQQTAAFEILIRRFATTGRDAFSCTYISILIALRLFRVGGEISMTDSSGKPYLSSTTTTTNGSMNSVNTTSTTLGSNGSSFTLPKAPARSSLKKKPADGLGIQNPGFSGSSPTFSRNGSVKKVRIQTHSTDV